MDDDEFDEDAFLQYLFEKWEGDLNDSYELFRTICDHLAENGKTMPSLVAGLIQAAKHLARDNEAVLGPDFFELSVAEVLAGGDGLHVRLTDDRDENL